MRALFVILLLSAPCLGQAERVQELSKLTKDELVQVTVQAEERAADLERLYAMPDLSALESTVPPGVAVRLENGFAFDPYGDMDVRISWTHDNGQRVMQIGRSHASVNPIAVALAAVVVLFVSWLFYAAGSYRNVQQAARND